MKLKFPTLIHPSTIAWLREARAAKDYSLFDALHGYIYARWVYFYISVGTGQHPISKRLAPFATRLITLLTHPKKGRPPATGQQSHTPAEGMSAAAARANPTGQAFADTYHGKVVPLEAAKQLVSVRQEVRLTNLEKIIPYTRARDIILHDPDHLAVLDCPCRVARKNPCLPLDVCLIVGEPFVSFITGHEPQRARRITSDEAVAILQAEDQRGHAHHAFFKDAMLGRFYAICNCCDCCCGAMQAHHNGTPMLAHSGFQVAVEAERCKACGLCEKYCPFHAVTVNGSVSIDPAKCMGCGICVNKCKQGALALQRDASLGEPLEIHKLMEMNLEELGIH